MHAKHTSNDVSTSRFQELLVADIRIEADNVKSLRLRSVHDQSLPLWEPGAHIDITVGDGLVRQYSLCGSVSDRRFWRIAVLREPDSRGGSDFIHRNVGRGDTVYVGGPRNHFALAPSERYLFIAGGIGITPILPMIRHVAAQGRQWTLLYGGRTRSSMAFIEELESIDGGTSYVWPQDQFGILNLQSWLGEPDDRTSVYCCGPEPLLNAVEEMCLNWPRGALHVERFAANSSVGIDGGAFDVQLARSGQRVRVPPDLTILEALESAGLEIDNSCRAGICGTCLVDVVSGEPEHNDDVLTDDERESKTCILPCVSRSKTALLVIDL